MILINPYRYATEGGGGFSGSFDYANPGGSGDRTSLITISANFSPGAGALERWVDGNQTNSDSFSFKFNSGQNTGNEFTLDFGGLYEFNEWTGTFSISSALGTWKLEGSTDNSNWTTLHASFTMGGATSVTYTPTLTGPYRYYKWTQTGGNTQTSTRMIEGRFQIRNS